VSNQFIFPCGTVRNVWKNRDGYLSLKVKLKTHTVHRLVYEYHHGKIPDGLTVNHKDGDKYNNTIENLELMTFSENAKHSWANGLARTCKGEKHGRAILDDMKVLTILTMPKNPKNGIGDGWTNKSLSDLFGVSVTRISAIRNGKEWKHINGAIRDNASNI